MDLEYIRQYTEGAKHRRLYLPDIREIQSLCVLYHTDHTKWGLNNGFNVLLNRVVILFTGSKKCVFIFLSWKVCRSWSDCIFTSVYAGFIQDVVVIQMLRDGYVNNLTFAMWPNCLLFWWILANDFKSMLAEDILRMSWRTWRANCACLNSVV